MRLMEHPRLHWVWRRLIRSPLPVPVYYWLLDLLTTLAMVHAEQQGKRTSADMRRHLEGHDVLDWLAALVPNGVAAAGR